jgi:alkanesulfonate monooxygenase SsuD/methylene tetrahydromethanopterin reductase-like flavin-dependent oxidoreductase (luciferase family)
MVFRTCCDCCRRRAPAAVRSEVMKFGFVSPGGRAREQLELAEAADRAGWDGFFVWEAAYGVDAWTLLSAIAMRTSRLKLGTMLTPIPWRRPWKLASQVATLDELSDGRAILTIGLGAVDDALGNTGEVTDRVLRAEMMDEAIDIIKGLWAGRKKHAGKHYNVDLNARADLDQALPPGRQIPIWVVGAWPRPKSMRRALRCDGVLPVRLDPGATGFPETKPNDVAETVAWLRQHSAGPDFDVVVEGETPADDAAKAADIVRPWAQAGATWWTETRWSALGDRRTVRERVEAGPPRL